MTSNFCASSTDSKARAGYSWTSSLRLPIEQPPFSQCRIQEAAARLLQSVRFYQPQRYERFEPSRPHGVVPSLFSALASLFIKVVHLNQDVYIGIQAGATSSVGKCHCEPCAACCGAGRSNPAPCGYIATGPGSQRRMARSQAGMRLRDDMCRPFSAGTSQPETHRARLQSVQ